MLHGFHRPIMRPLRFPLNEDTIATIGYDVVVLVKCARVGKWAGKEFALKGDLYFRAGFFTRFFEYART